MNIEFYMNWLKNVLRISKIVILVTVGVVGFFLIIYTLVLTASKTNNILYYIILFSFVIAFIIIYIAYWKTKIDS